MKVTVLRAAAARGGSCGAARKKPEPSFASFESLEGVSEDAQGDHTVSNLILEKVKAGAKIVDVRTIDEFRDGAYPGAVNIPVSELGARLSEVPKNVPIILYCASGARSSAAAQLLRRSGYSDVVNAGGLGDMP
jgi:rhodanese-related sulfurtransferase